MQRDALPWPAKMFARRKLCRAFSLLCAVAAWGGVADPAVALDWYRWRGPDLNGISKETGWSTAWPKDGPKQLWRANVGQGYSSVSVSNGRLFTMGVSDGQESVRCFDALSGRELWKHTYPYVYEPQYYEGGSSVTPTVDGPLVYSLGQSGELFCFDAATGRIVWSRSILKQLQMKLGDWGFASSPLVEGNLLLLNAGSFGTAVDKTNGKIVWTTGRDVHGYASAVPFDFGGRRCAAIFTQRHLVAVETQTGQEVWRFPWKTTYDVNAADPILAGTQAFISSAYGAGCALVDFSGPAPKEVWRNKNMMNQFNSCVLIAGHLYGVNGETGKATDFRCLDWRTGEVKWKHDGLGLGALMAADGKLIILSEKGELVIAAASPDAFQPLVRAQVIGGKCWTTPVLANGRIYCRNAKGDLVCVDVRGSGDSATGGN